jgi:glucosamine-6-phosphate deaminase
MTLGVVGLRAARDERALARAGADIVADVVMTKPDAVITLATGQSPTPIYRELAARRVRREVDFSQVRVFELDGYVGIALADTRSLYAWLERDVLLPLGIPARNVVRLRGESADADAACREYDRALDDAGGYDLAVLGLGPNGHVAFNEPPADPGSDAHVLSVTVESVESAVRYWGTREAVPRRAITTGMRRLIAARSVLLVARGEAKRTALRRTLEEETPDVPASLLRRSREFVVLTDLPIGHSA